jgi:ankyrin repeat protein
MTRSSSCCWARGADINVSDRYYGNALYAASARGQDRIVGSLLSKDTDVNAQGGFYGNVLQATSMVGHNKDRRAAAGQEC